MERKQKVTTCETAIYIRDINSSSDLVLTESGNM